jgi:outer membrane protein
LKNFIVFFLLFCISEVKGQVSITLEQAIELGIANNLELKQQALGVKVAQQQLSQANAEKFPTVNLFANQYFNAGRGINQLTYKFENQYFDLNSYSLVSSLTLYNGHRLAHAVNQSRYALEASKLEVESYKVTLTLNIISQYLDILINQELLKVQEEQIAATGKQVERIKKLFEEKEVTRKSLLEIEAQLAQEEMENAGTVHALKLSRLSLLQLLRMDTMDERKEEQLILTDSAMLTATATLPDKPFGEIYNLSCDYMPQLKFAQYNLKSNTAALRFVKAGRLPKLSLVTTMGTGYTSSIVSTADTTRSERYSNQMRNNRNFTLALNLDIPLFNNNKVKTEVEMAKIQMSRSGYALKIAEQNLYKELSVAHVHLIDSYNEYLAVQKYAIAIDKIYADNTTLYNNRMITGLDYLDSKNKLKKAKSNEIQMKYKFLFNRKIIDLYQGKLSAY